MGFNEVTFRSFVVADKVRDAAYIRAREQQMESWADEIIEDATNSERDTVESDGGREVANHEWIQRSRLIVDTKKWIMSKLYPRRYGDKVENKIVGEDGGPVTIAWMPVGWKPGDGDSTPPPAPKA